MLRRYGYVHEYGRSRSTTSLLGVFLFFTIITFFVIQIHFFSQITNFHHHPSHPQHQQHQSLEKNDLHEHAHGHEHGVTYDAQYYIQHPRIAIIIPVNDHDNNDNNDNYQSMIENLNITIGSIYNTIPKEDYHRIIDIYIIISDPWKYFNNDNHANHENEDYDAHENKLKNDLDKIFHFHNDDNDNNGNNNGNNNDNDNHNQTKTITYNLFLSKEDNDTTMMNHDIRYVIKEELVQNKIKNLEKAHEKSIYEDVTMVFIKPGSEIITFGWLDVITDALMSSTMDMSMEMEMEMEMNMDSTHMSIDSMHSTDKTKSNIDMDSIVNPVNAISFALDGEPYGQIYSFHTTSQTIAPSVLLSNNPNENANSNANLNSNSNSNSLSLTSYPTPIMEGSVTAMKLQTYLSFPVHDEFLDTYTSINLEMSFNLWLCGDGIDILPQLIVKKNKNSSNNNSIHNNNNHDKNMKKNDAERADEYKHEQKKDRVLMSKGKQKHQKEQHQKEILDAMDRYKFVLSNVEKQKLSLLRLMDTWKIHPNGTSSSTSGSRSSSSTTTDVKGKKNHIAADLNVNVFELSQIIQKAYPLPTSIHYCRDYNNWFTAMSDILLSNDTGFRNGSGNANANANDDKVNQLLQLDNNSNINNDIKKYHTKKGEQEQKNEGDDKNDNESKKLLHLLPSKPLNLFNQNMISHVNPVNLEYDGSDRHVKKQKQEQKTKRKKRPDSFTSGVPKAIAYDEDGKSGYVHDVTSLKNNPPKFQVTDLTLDAMCSIQDESWKLLTEQVHIDFKGHEAAEQSALSSNENTFADAHRDNINNNSKPRAKIMCIVYTIESNHNRIPAIRETWGTKCDGFLVASNKTDLKLDIVKIAHNGIDHYSQIWFKVLAIWSYVYDHYYNDYDWFHIGGDDLFVLVENLRLYVESEDIQVASNGGVFLPTGNEKVQTPLHLGRRFFDSSPFNTGGPGYTLNRAALKSFVTKTSHTLLSRITSAEDLMMSTSLRKISHLEPYDTRDENGAQRYHHFSPEAMYNYYNPEHNRGTGDFYKNLSIDQMTEGLKCCSETSIAFHYIVSSELMRRMYAILYGKCRGSFVNGKMLVPQGL